ncbi:hypothetical protein AB4262_18290 [Vibrio breoganii]|uniref:hypothetical protein n=1 Tax=Vibrio breoganii TaxID=553239 RepID=UPI000C867B9D|nr:hypothetical protein [Vibrio breoganii]PMK16329.1 hypothetical protein BCU06_12300 [Vibrio breoganii]PMM85216.1 hypothetical protein BCT45_01265 [Vibrio breoganii]PMO78660.1 hypothetical protein BCT00_17235 [Vibrio breoganii]
MKIGWPPAWLPVFLGLLLNVLAIVISSQILDDLAQKNAALYEGQSNNLRSIQLAWNRVENLERKKETLLVVLGHDDSNQAVNAELAKQIEVWTGKPVPELSINNLQTLSLMLEREQNQQRDLIDKYYLNNISLLEMTSKNDMQISRYKNIALFLQIFGLALILARDLRRKD